MTREDVAKEYRLNEHGTVISPGKFEGKPWWVVPLWDAFMDGAWDDEFEDDGGTVVSVFLRRNLTEEISKELKGTTHAITLWEDDQGFVRHSERTKEEAEMVERDAHEALHTPWEEKH